jgi:tRNA(Leu) C34 or U34 (ribose-2'-O)-methylase TrmL
VPLAGRAESLNLAAAAAVLLYEASRRRGFSVPTHRPREAAVGR